ncbi:MAG: hypothetical protein U9Q70_01770 [Chloroflexota bacterium]|nr:hypothetical protein [Chloroflexota bacterium]
MDAVGPRVALSGGIAALLLPFFPLLLSTFGAETCFYVMLILATFVLYAAEQPV